MSVIRRLVSTCPVFLALGKTNGVVQAKSDAPLTMPAAGVDTGVSQRPDEAKYMILDINLA